MSLFTIGYEAINLDNFVECLKENKIDIVIDVRQNPVSRKPDFSRIRLQLALAIKDISYEHQQILGCPTHIRAAYKISKNWANYVESYNAYIQPLSDEMFAIAVRAKGNNIALMCFEANPHFCHRSLISNEVAKRYGVATTHLISEAQIKASNRYLRLNTI